jgi:hypothetical protein
VNCAAHFADEVQLLRYVYHIMLLYFAVTVQVFSYFKYAAATHCMDTALFHAGLIGLEQK